MMALPIIFFLIFAILILFGAHYLIYFSAIQFFSIINPNVKHFLVISLSFLAVSFIIASLLSHWKENAFTQIYYFISGVWLGLLTNLVLSFLLAWIVIGIIRLFGFNPNTAIIGLIFLILAISYTIYGIWNAFHPQIKNITVTIPNLPEEWKGKKIVQLSDVHLGLIHQSGFMQEIAAKVDAQKPEMVVITGDLFDGMDGDLNAFLKPLDNIIAPRGIFYVTGNHETYLGLNEVFSTLDKTNIKILKDEVVDVNGLKIIGIAYPQRGETKNIFATLESLKGNFEGQPNIFLYHSPVDIDKFKNSGVNLQLAGHTHRGQLFPFGYITYLIYKGYDYGLYPMGDYTLYTSCGTGTWGPPIRTGNTPEIVVITLQ